MNRTIILLLLALVISPSAFAQQTTTMPDTSKKPVAEVRTTFYVEPGTYGTKRESDPPNYVRKFSDLGFKGTEKLSWLDVGLDHRLRGEYRKNDIRRAESINSDLPLLIRTRAFIGIRGLIDPLRFGVELEDAQRNNSNYAWDNRDVNQHEIIQAYGELYFKNALGKDKLGNNRPLSIRGGRMWLEMLDRRLIANNQWRNTTNNFTGVKVSLGADKNDFALDLLALQPMTRLLTDFDTINTDVWFYGAVGHWRKWSKVITIEPYYLALHQTASAANTNRDRDIHGVGLRLYGWAGTSGFNGELTGMYQTGTDNKETLSAHMFTAEVGYTFKSSKLKPRISLFYGQVSGDSDPNDNVSNRFERYYGFARPWNADDYIIPENVMNPKLKFEIEPAKNLRFDMGYSFFWLQSGTDRFNNLLAQSSFNRDKKGASGSFLGHGFDARILYNPISFLNLTFGYSHFTTGEFVQTRQEAANGNYAMGSDFAYLELSINFFEYVKFVNGLRAKKK